MCGIAGIVNHDNKPVDKELLIAMRDTLSHRGPDDSGIWLEDNVGLGHRRLSIIDLSQAGHQPMHNEDNTIWLVFNGEIYNYVEIKEELVRKGHRFVSNTDVEVIIHAYEEAGEDCVKLFNGMWAFVIWDVKDKKLFASRDRFGEKPFYYYNDGGSFYFSSEINAFFMIPSFKKDINQKAVFLYLVYNQTDAEEETFFQGIRQLLPAHNLVFKESRLKGSINIGT